MTEEELRVRGFRRSFEEIAEEAREHTARAILAITPALGEPIGEFSREELGALERGGADFSPLGLGALDPLEQTIAAYAAMLASSYTTSEVARLLEVSEGRVRQRISEGTLYGVKLGRGHRLPSFQFAGGREVPGIGDVLRVIDRGLHPVGVENWFTLPNPDLYLDEEEERPVSPKEWLLAGKGSKTLVPLAGDL